MPAALIIGARNLGFAIIERLLADGWDVCAGARSSETLEKVRAAGADALEVDVLDPASVHAALEHVARRHGRVDLAVNAASPYGGGGQARSAAARSPRLSHPGLRTGQPSRPAARSRFSTRAAASCARRAVRRR